MHDPWDADPPSSRLPQEMTQRFPRTQLSPQVHASPPARHQPADSLRQRITRRRGPESLGPQHPSVRGPDPSRAADPFGMEGWELGRGAVMLPEAPPEAREDCQFPPGGKVRRHLGQGNFSSRAGLELSAQSGQLHNPKGPCRSRSDPGAHIPGLGSGQSQSTSGGKGWRARAAAERRRRRPIGSQGGSPRSPH